MAEYIYAYTYIYNYLNYICVYIMHNYILFDTHLHVQGLQSEKQAWLWVLTLPCIVWPWAGDLIPVSFSSCVIWVNSCLTDGWEDWVKIFSITHSANIYWGPRVLLATSSTRQHRSMTLKSLQYVCGVWGEEEIFNKLTQIYTHIYSYQQWLTIKEKAYTYTERE